MKISDYVGKLVRLKITVTTLGGMEHRAGGEYQVVGHWRGRLNLDQVGTRVTLRSVDPSLVEIVPEQVEDKPKVNLILSVVERAWPEELALAIVEESLVLFNIVTREVVDWYPGIAVSHADKEEGGKVS
jgi:hypothetical protein